MSEENVVENVYWTLFKYAKWNMYIAATAAGLCYIGSKDAAFEELASWSKQRLPNHILEEKVSVLQPYVSELVDYFEGRRKNFSLPVDLHGTQFQQTVWKAVQEVEYGEKVSYTDIAERIQKTKSVRAVGAAIGANPVLITVPCHRVIAKSGKLTGYRGGLEMKEELLDLEK